MAEPNIYLGSAYGTIDNGLLGHGLTHPATMKASSRPKSPPVLRNRVIRRRPTNIVAVV